MQTKSSCQAKVRTKIKDEVKELKNLIEELKANVVKKDTRRDHLQKRSDKFCILLGEVKGSAIKEFTVSSEYTNLLDRNYAMRFEDFRMVVLELFLEIDFNPSKLRIAAESSLLQISPEDINVEDDSSTPAC